MHLPTHDGIVRWRLKDADTPLRGLITSFLIMLTLGYSIGLLLVDHTTSGTPQGLIEQYNGTQQTDGAVELKFEKSPQEVYVFLHNHILSLSLIFFAVGIVFYFCSIVGNMLKVFLMVEPFIAIATTFGGIWLMRFVSDAFSWVVIVSGISMVACYLLMVLFILRELWVGK